MYLFALAAPLLALWLLAAHLFRAGLWPLALASALLPLLLALPRAWCARLVQAVLLVGALEWLRTLSALAAMRISGGQPWLRMAAILGTVAVLTGLAALVFRSRRLRTRYRLPPG